WQSLTIEWRLQLGRTTRAAIQPGLGFAADDKAGTASREANHDPASMFAREIENLLDSQGTLGARSRRRFRHDCSQSAYWQQSCRKWSAGPALSRVRQSWIWV